MPETIMFDFSKIGVIFLLQLLFYYFLSEIELLSIKHQNKKLSLRLGSYGNDSIDTSKRKR